MRSPAKRDDPEIRRGESTRPLRERPTAAAPRAAEPGASLPAPAEAPRARDGQWRRKQSPQLRKRRLAAVRAHPPARTGGPGASAGLLATAPPRCPDLAH